MDDTLEPYAALAEFRDLAFGESLLVWALRVWVDIANPHEGPGSRLAVDRLRTAFERAGAPLAALQFDGLWSIIGMSSKRQIDVRCTGGMSVSPDEILFVREIACRQRLLTPGPCGLLAVLCPATARRLAAPLAQGLATSLEQARLMLPARADGRLLNIGGESGGRDHAGQDGAGGGGTGKVVTLH